MAVFCTLFKHYIIIWCICKVNTLNENFIQIYVAQFVSYIGICIQNEQCKHLYTHDIHKAVVQGLRVLSCEVVAPCVVDNKLPQLHTLRLNNSFFY